MTVTSERTSRSIEDLRKLLEDLMCHTIRVEWLLHKAGGVSPKAENAAHIVTRVGDALGEAANHRIALAMGQVMSDTDLHPHRPACRPGGILR